MVPPRNSLLIFQEIFPILYLSCEIFRIQCFFQANTQYSSASTSQYSASTPVPTNTQKSLGTRFPPYLKTLHEGMGGGGGGGRRSIGPLHSTFDTIHPIDLIYTKLSLYFQLSKATWCPKYVSIGRAEKCLLFSQIILVSSNSSSDCQLSDFCYHRTKCTTKYYSI